MKMKMEKVRIEKDRSTEYESVVDEVTNATLMDYPVHCSYRTTMLEQPTFHSHRGYELYLCMRGKGHFIVGEQIYTLGVGTFTVVGPMASHLSRPHLNSPFHRYILGIERSYVEQLFVEDRECSLGIKPWLPDPTSDSIHMQLNAQQLMRLQEILAQLEGEIQRKQACYPLLVKSLLLQLFAQLGRYQAESSNIIMGGNGNEKQMVKGILSYMMEHHHEPLSAEKLCRQFLVSRSYLFRVFKQHTGVTMNEFLVSIRMTKAKELLQATDLPITEVAGRVGFQDVSHFCHTFKRLLGMTPSGYRSISKSM